MKEHKINRRKFFETSGNMLLTGVGVTVFASLLASCGKDKNPTGPGDNNGSTDKTFVVNLSDNQALQQVGGFKTFQINSKPVFLIKTASETFLALSMVCTHQGCTVDYVSSSKIFDCPCHDSQFEQNGTVRKGPAARNLDTYRTEYKSDTNQVSIFY